MRHLEHWRDEQARRLVAEFFEAADPELAGVLGLFPFAENAILVDFALNRLPLPGLAFRSPAGERAGLKIKIQRLAIRADGDDAGIAQRLVERIAHGLVLGKRSGREQGSKKD